jgi:imidazolonepropionase-like amidohydrolase
MKARVSRVAFAIGIGMAVGLPAAGAAQQAVAITNAEIHVRGGQVLRGATLVLSNGRIQAVGTSVEIPAGARQIDGTGKIVTPGLIDSGSQVGLGEIGGQAPGTQDASTSLDDLGASFNPVWAVNPENTHIPITRLRGVTASVVRPGGGPLFDGQGAVIALDGTRVGEMILNEVSGVYTALGESGSGNEGGGSRAALRMRLEDAFWDVRADMLNEAAGDDDEATDDPLRKGGRSNLNARNKEALKAVLRGEVPLVVTVNRLSDIHMALDLKEAFGFRMVINGGAEAWRAAEALTAADVAVIVNPTDNLPTFDGLGATMENAGRLARAGVTVLFAGGRSLTHLAGLAIANGMDRSAAGDGLTAAAAEVWGIADQTGTIEAGKRADIVVWSGDPFELSTSVEHVFIGGREIPEDSRQERLFDRYRDLTRYRRIGG